MDPIRRGLLLGKIADLLGMTNDQVTDLLQKKGTANGRMAQGPAQLEESTAVPEPIQLPKLIGRTAIEARVLGSLLSAPEAFQQVREEMTLELFSPEGLQPLAAKVIEYLENCTDLAECSLADFLSVLGDSPLMMHAIEVQQLVDGLGNYAREIKEGVRRLAESSVSRGTVTRSDDPATLLQIQAGVKGRSNPIPPNPYFRR
jgi:hypothetical protein